MKKVLVAVLVLLAAAVVALGFTFVARPLPEVTVAIPPPPPAMPPPGLRIFALQSGRMQSQAGFAYRGGKLGEPRDFAMAGVLVQHPQGNLLFDAGFGRNVDAHMQTIPALMRATSKYTKGTPIADQLAAAGIEPASLKGVVLTHAHWDHVSGLEDLKGAPVWINQAELDFVRDGGHATALARSLGELPWHVYEFTGGPYLGFAHSLDVYGDGSVVLVPAPGHTPGSIVAFVTLPSQRRYALVGDLVWQREAIALRAERPWLSRRLVDLEPERVRHWIAHLDAIVKALPGTIVVPAHDQRVMDALPMFRPAGG